MSWSAASGGSVVLNLERGFGVVLNPTSYSDGVSKMQIDFNEVTQNFSKHDKPAFWLGPVPTIRTWVVPGGKVMLQNTPLSTAQRTINSSNVPFCSHNLK